MVRGLIGSARTSSRPLPRDGRQSAVLTLTNHPSTGPLFSGTQQQPFVCQSGSLPDPHRGPARRGGSTTAARSSPAPATSISPAVRRPSSPRPSTAVTDPRRRPADLASYQPAGATVQPFIVRVDTDDHQPRHRPDRDAGRSRRPRTPVLEQQAHLRLRRALRGRLPAGHPGGRHLVAEPAGPGLRRGLQLLERPGAELQRRRRGGGVRDDPRTLHRGPRVRRRTRWGSAAPAGRPRRTRSPTTIRGCSTASSSGAAWPTSAPTSAQLAFDARSAAPTTPTRIPGRLTPQQLRGGLRPRLARAPGRDERPRGSSTRSAGFSDDCRPGRLRLQRPSNPRGARGHRLGPDRRTSTG